MEDKVNHPLHYTYGDIETIEVIEAWQLDYHIGNAIKYLSRYRNKGQPIEDLEKAVWYINRKITYLKEKERSNKLDIQPPQAPEGWKNSTFT